MTATGGGAAVPGTDAPARTRDDDGPGVTATHAPRLRTVLGLAQVEASLLVRSLLVLAGLVGGGGLIWLTIDRTEPLWWNVSWWIGAGQLILGMAVLIAAQLAAGRPRRAGLADLYASFPTSAATRTAGYLAGLAGVVPASLLLAGAATAVVQARGAIGTPDFVVLAGGVLLVIATGAAGVAIGSRLSHPVVGVLVALVLFLCCGAYQALWDGAIWLVPWEIMVNQLASLPGPLAGYPQAGAHALELAGLAVLAGIVALAVTVSRARARAGLAAAGIAAVAVICFAGALQLRPIPTSAMNHLVTDVADPASVQRCTTAAHVRYCLYPGFGSQLPSFEAPVHAVLARLPAQPSHPLMIRQVVGLSLSQWALAHGQPSREMSRWDAQLQQAPGNAFAAPAATIYLPVGSWPAAGGQLADANFDLALATAEWAVGIPPQNSGSPAYQPCVPVGQAREAIAIWLAILATHRSAGELHGGLNTGPGGGITGTGVGNTIVQTWTYPGMGSGYVTPPGDGPQNTAAGYLLASAMTSVPEQRVSHVLTDAWGTWLNWRTSDAQLARALGVRMPSVRSFPPGPSGGASGAASAAQSPVCTSGQ